MSKEQPADMSKVWARFKWNLKNLFNNETNPFIDEDNEESGLKAKKRTALEDITHATENLFREGWRNWKKRK